MSSASAGAWSNGAGAWQMKFAERRPFSASDDAENGSKIANRNSLWEIKRDRLYLYITGS